jgi:lipoyl(octanoyl) transferase
VDDLQRSVGRDAHQTVGGTPALQLSRMISVVQLGTISYSEGLRLQQKLIELRKTGAIGDVLLLLEHTPVITLGRNAKTANVLASTESLATRGVEVFDCDRGGDVTFHGPGQIVGYPIFDLRGFGRESSSQPSAAGHQEDPSAPARESLPAGRKTLGVVDYVRRLEEVLIRTCGDFGIASKRVQGLTGVWTEPSRPQVDREGHAFTVGEETPIRAGLGKGKGSIRAELDPTSYGALALEVHDEAKIAAIGVHISRSVTSHGFALNVNAELTYFDLIVPCGIASKPVTSMQKELGREVDANAVAHSLSRNFGSVFGRQTLWIETLDALLGNAVGVPMKLPSELRALRGEDDFIAT